MSGEKGKRRTYLLAASAVLTGVLALCTALSVQIYELLLPRVETGELVRRELFTSLEADGELVKTKQGARMVFTLSREEAERIAPGMEVRIACEDPRFSRNGSGKVQETRDVGDGVQVTAPLRIKLIMIQYVISLIYRFIKLPDILATDIMMRRTDLQSLPLELNNFIRPCDGFKCTGLIFCFFVHFSSFFSFLAEIFLRIKRFVPIWGNMLI